MTDPPAAGLPTPPRMPGHPLLGSALDLRRSQIATYERAMREHGDVVRLVVGPPGLRFEMYCVFHPEGVRRVLTGWRDGYAKGNRFYTEIAKAFGWGLLTSEGELWQRHRRLIQPLFTRKAIEGYADRMATEAADLADRWIQAGSVDAHADSVRLSLRVLGAAIFGDDVEATTATSGLGLPGAERPRVPPCDVAGGDRRPPGPRRRTGRLRPPAGPLRRGRRADRPSPVRGHRRRPVVPPAPGPRPGIRTRPWTSRRCATRR